MNWWSILGIPYNSDLKTIKKAYAKLLKKHNPEDDPKGYQRLREAYDQAIKYAKKNNINHKKHEQLFENEFEDTKDETNSEDEEVTNENEVNMETVIDNKDDLNTKADINIENEMKTDNDKESDAEINSQAEIEGIEENDAQNENEEELDIEKNSNLDGEKDKKLDEEAYTNVDQQSDRDENYQNRHVDRKYQINEFINKLHIIYEDMSLRINHQVWKELLNMDIMWDINSFPVIEEEIFKFLASSGDKKLPYNIWLMLDDNFNWTKNEMKLYERYAQIVVDRFIKKLKIAKAESYRNVNEINTKYKRDYLSQIQKAYESLKLGDYYKAGAYLLAACNLLNYDREVGTLINRTIYYYKLRDFNNTMDCCKKAFEKSNFDMNLSLCIAVILGADEKFNEAISYDQLYLSFNNNDKLALTYLAYCYYYTDNIQMAKNSFEKLLNFEEEDIRIKEFLNNIEVKLNGQQVEKIELINSEQEQKVEKKKSFSDDRKKRKRKSFDILVICAAVVYCILISGVALNIILKVGDEISDRGITEVSEENKYYYEDGNTFIRIVRSGQIVTYHTNVIMDLKTVEPIEYFKLSEPFQDKIIVSEAEVNSYNLHDKIESQLYIGTFNDCIILFADKNYNEQTLRKDKKYVLKGAMSEINSKSFNDIETKYKLNKKNKIHYWQENTYIDCSPKEIEKVSKNTEIFEKHGTDLVKVVKTYQEFRESTSGGLHSIYLKNIKPLNCYVEGTYVSSYIRKEQLNDNKHSDNTYNQAYVGEVDGKNILILDPNFSMNSLDSSGGCTVEGRQRHIYKGNIKIDSIDVDEYYLSNNIN